MDRKKDLTKYKIQLKKETLDKETNKKEDQF